MDEYELHDSFFPAPLLYRYISEPPTSLPKTLYNPSKFSAVDGPYRSKARTIYEELRSNLIRYACLY